MRLHRIHTPFVLSLSKGAGETAMPTPFDFAQDERKLA